MFNGQDETIVNLNPEISYPLVLFTLKVITNDSNDIVNVPNGTLFPV